jgi:hypothetical protein
MTKSNLLAEVLSHKTGYLPPTKLAKKYEELETEGFLYAAPRGYLLSEQGIKYLDELDGDKGANFTYKQLVALRKLLEPEAPSTEDEETLYDHLPENIPERDRRNLTKMLINELAYIEFGVRIGSDMDQEDGKAIIAALVTETVKIPNPNLLSDKELLIECVKTQIDLTHHI